MGQFCDLWKLAVITPLLKKAGLELSTANYRPVSNLAFLSKIVEKAVIRQLNDHVNSNNLHSHHQSAYKANFSTETALCLLVNNLLWAMERGEISIMVGLDLSAAFDTVDHEVLVSVLHHNYGIEDTALTWIKSYLKDRKMHVQIDNVTSSVKTFNYSVPQGSCLGPVLFNAYASTITDCINPDQDLGGYADDHYLRDSFKPSIPDAESKCVKRMETTVDSLLQWMSANSLKVNADKTEITVFGSFKTLTKTNVNQLRIGDQQISTNHKLKYLGVVLDNSLTFQDHINAKCKTAIWNIRKINKIRQFLDLKTAKLLASALVLSHLDYANSILCGLPNSTINKLQHVQNWAAKVVLKQTKYDSSTAALYTLHWLPVRQRINFKILCMIHKCLNNAAPEYLSCLIRVKIFERQTRLANTSAITLEVPFTRRSTFAQRAFSVYGPHLWNKLPVDIRQIQIYSLFKKLLKTFLFNEHFKDNVVKRT